MRITEVANRTGVSADQIRYLERKGFVESTRVQINKRLVRDFSEEAVRTIDAISIYLAQGFKYDVAHEKANQDIAQPRLI
mgnify:CR=1 FL=1